MKRYADEMDRESKRSKMDASSITVLNDATLDENGETQSDTVLGELGVPHPRVPAHSYDPILDTTLEDSPISPVAHLKSSENRHFASSVNPLSDIGNSMSAPRQPALSIPSTSSSFSRFVGNPMGDNASSTIIGAATSQTQEPPHLEPTTNVEFNHVEIPHGYTLLSSLAAGAAKTLNSVIGVVTYVTPVSRAKKGRRDLTRSLHIADPSHFTELFPPDKDGFRVNCFTTNYPEWLPAVNKGDILILLNIKVVRSDNGYSGVGYSDKLQWALFRSSDGTFVHGDLGSAPEWEGLAANGKGVPFSPFYHPEGGHYLKCCLALNGWWSEVVESRKVAMGTVHQAQVPASTSGRGREHMLMSETSMDMVNGGYFDCTVEIIDHGDFNDSNCSVYVTDYTPVSYGREQDCPPGLAHLILKIRMWDAARGKGAKMRRGEFYLLRNVRMVTSKDGFQEGKVCEDKVQLLDLKGAFTLEMKALLRRKEEHKLAQT